MNPEPFQSPFLQPDPDEPEDQDPKEDPPSQNPFDKLGKGMTPEERDLWERVWSQG